MSSDRASFCRKPPRAGVGIQYWHSASSSASTTSDFVNDRLPKLPLVLDTDGHVWRSGMDERSAADVHLKQNSNDDDRDDRDEVGGQIEGYNDPSSSSSSTQGTSSKSRHQRKYGDDQLDEDDFERILSRTTARRLLSLLEGIDTYKTPLLSVVTLSPKLRMVNVLLLHHVCYCCLLL